MGDFAYHEYEDTDTDTNDHINYLNRSPVKRNSLPTIFQSINSNQSINQSINRIHHDQSVTPITSRTNVHAYEPHLNGYESTSIQTHSRAQSINQSLNKSINTYQSHSRSQPLSRIHSPPKRKSIFRSTSSPDQPVNVFPTNHDHISTPSSPHNPRTNQSINQSISQSNYSFVDRLLMVKNEVSHPIAEPPRSPTSIDLLDQSASATFLLNSPTQSISNPFRVSESEWSTMSINQALSKTLKFHSPSLELAFNQDYFQRYFVSLRSTVLLCVAIWILFSITDFVKEFKPQPQRKNFPLTIGIRLGAAAVVAALCLAAYRRSVIAVINTRRLRWVIFLFIVLFGTCQTVFGVIERYTIDPTYATFVILIASMASPLFRLPFFMSVLCSVVLWLVFGVLTYFTGSFGHDLALFIATLIWLMGGIILSAYHSYTVEIGMRATFLQAAQLKFEEDQLAAMLARMLPKSAIKKTIPFVADSINQDWVTDSFDHSTIMFVKIDAFDVLSSSMDAEDVVQLLNRLFSEFDRLTESFGAYKVETISNVYMVAGGVPEPLSNHTSVLALLALAMMDAAVKIRNELDLTAFLTGCESPIDVSSDQSINLSTSQSTNQSPSSDEPIVTSFPLPLELKIGIHTGPVLAGVVGTKYPRYRLIHDTVNVASRMSTTCEANQIQLSQAAFHCLDERFVCQYRGSMPVKGKGNIDTYWLSAFLLSSEPSVTHSSNQSISQSINQSNNQSINVSSNLSPFLSSSSIGPLSINEALGHITQSQAAAEWNWHIDDQSISLSIKQASKQSVSQSTSPGRTYFKHRRQSSAPINHSSTRSTSQSINQFNRSDKPVVFIPPDPEPEFVNTPQVYGLYSTVNQSVHQSVSQSVNPSDDQSVSQSLSQTNSRSVNQSSSQSNGAMNLQHRARETKDGHFVHQRHVSVSQSIDQPITQIIRVDVVEDPREANQSTNQSISRSLTRSTHHLRISTSHSPSRSQPNTPLLTPIPYPSDSFNLSINQSVSQPTNPLPNLSINQSISPLVSFSRSAPSSPLSVASSDSWSSDDPLDSTNTDDQSTSQSINQSINQSMLDESVWSRLSFPTRLIDHFRLAYSNVHLEHIFQRHWSDRYIYQSMRGMLICTFAMLVFGIYDTLEFTVMDEQSITRFSKQASNEFHPQSTISLQSLWLIRCFSLFVSSVCLLVCWYHPTRFVSYHQPLVSVSWTILALLQISLLSCKITSIPTDSNTRSLVAISGVASTLLAIISPSFLIGLQFGSVCGVTCMILVFYLSLGLATVTSSDMWITWYLAAATCLAMRASHSSEKFERQDFYRARRLDLERRRTRALYDRMLPPEIMKQVQQLIHPTLNQSINQSISPSLAVAHVCPHTGVLYCDLVGFTRIAGHVPAGRIVELLNVLFSVFDALTSVHRVYKVDTIGDAYLACSGVLDRSQKVHDLVKCALDFLAAMKWMPKPIQNQSINQSISPIDNRLAIRAGIHTGSVVAGVVGQTMLRYHLFGPTVTIAEEMEQKAATGTLAITQSTHQSIEHDFICKSINSIHVQQQSINQGLTHVEIQRWEVCAWKGERQTVNQSIQNQSINQSNVTPVIENQSIDERMSLNAKVRMILHRVRTQNIQSINQSINQSIHPSTSQSARRPTTYQSNVSHAKFLTVPGLGSIN